MAGNVWEWVSDGYAPYPAVEQADPHVPLTPGARGVLRGGSWDYAPTSAKTTYRLPFWPNSGNVSFGFRCALDAHD
jgi:eukaryotic-like serine/threonine-protein kinase